MLEMTILHSRFEHVTFPRWTGYDRLTRSGGTFEAQFFRFELEATGCSRILPGIEIRIREEAKKGEKFSVMGLGIHVRKAGYDTTADAIVAMQKTLPLQCAQIFVAMNSESDVNIGNVGKADIPLLVHVAHIGNVWADTPWNWKFFLHQLNIATRIGAPLVVHLPLRPVDEVVQVCEKMAGKIKEKNLRNARLLFENPASAKPETCWGRPERVREFVEKMERRVKKKMRWALCVDTAHLWSSLPPSAAISTKRGSERWLAEIGVRARARLGAVHLNGSYEKAGSGVDKHAIPGSPMDAIWNSPDSGSLPLWLDFARKLPVVVEWNRGSEKYVQDLFEAYDSE